MKLDEALGLENMPKWFAIYLALKSTAQLYFVTWLGGVLQYLRDGTSLFWFGRFHELPIDQK